MAVTGTPSVTMMRLPAIWAALAALGSGLIQVALGAGLSFGLAAPWVTVGTASLLWVGAVFVRGRIVFPRLALILFLLPLVMWGAMALFAPHLAELFPLTTMLVSSALSLYVTVTMGIMLRQRSHNQSFVSEHPREQKGRPTAVTMFGLITGALVVSAFTLLALSYTRAGQAAKQHHEHVGISIGETVHRH